MNGSSSIWDVLNSLVAVAAMLVSVYAVHHSRRVDRRLSVEPYFRHKWRSVHGPYSASLRNLSAWLESFERSFQNTEDDLPAVPSLSPAIHREIDWTYDPKARLSFDQLSALVVRMSADVKKLDWLRFMTSETRMLVLGLRDIGASDHQDSDEFNQYIRDVCTRCLGRTEVMIGELRESPTYKSMVQRQARAVAEDVARLRRLLDLVGKTVDHYGAKFDAT